MNKNTAITSYEMAALDLNCEYYGLSRLQLMENAGRGLAEEITKLFISLDSNLNSNLNLNLNSNPVLIFAGLGNNGGDSFVASRILLSNGIKSKIYLLGRKRDVKSDIAKRNLELAILSGVEVVEADLRSLKSFEIESGIVVDAMLGTGVRGSLREPFYTAVELINSSEAKVVAVDVPTGLNPDTGEYVEAVKADVTVTFHKPKPGLLKPEVKDVVGTLIVKDIGIPPFMERLTGPGDVKLTFKRDLKGHKGNHGRILVIGGGDYTGAPTLSALASLKAGADLAFVAVPEKIREVVSGYSPELIVSGFEVGEDGKGLNELCKLASKCHVAVIGMGLKEEWAGEIFDEVSKVCKKIVLDAGGISAIKSNPKLVEERGLDVIVTPHSAEFSRNFGCEAELGNVLKVAKDYGITVLLKGVEDVIANAVKWKVNRTGNAGMTVGGTGDILSGVVGAFFAGNEAFRAASSAAFVTGLAGDLCFEELGYCYTALDVLNRLPNAIAKALEFS